MMGVNIKKLTILTKQANAQQDNVYNIAII